MLGPPIHLSDSNVDTIPAPLLGQHTEEVLRAELGLSENDIEVLAIKHILRIELQVAQGVAAG